MSPFFAILFFDNLTQFLLQSKNWDLAVQHLIFIYYVLTIANFYKPA